MKCPYCSSDNDKVVDSRASREGAAIRRRRQCLDCERRFTTYEYIEETQVVVIKKDNRREPYDRQKLKSGILIACKKRPISSQQIEEIADRVEHSIEKNQKHEVASLEIGEFLIDELFKIDEIAYIRFASVYRNFKSADEFINQVGKLSQ